MLKKQNMLFIQLTELHVTFVGFNFSVLSYSVKNNTTANFTVFYKLLFSISTIILQNRLTDFGLAFQFLPL